MLPIREKARVGRPDRSGTIGAIELRVSIAPRSSFGAKMLPCRGGGQPSPGSAYSRCTPQPLPLGRNFAILNTDYARLSLPTFPAFMYPKYGFQITVLLFSDFGLVLPKLVSGMNPSYWLIHERGTVEGPGAITRRGVVRNKRHLLSEVLLIQQKPGFCRTCSDAGGEHEY